MYENFQKHLSNILGEIRNEGLYKNERIIVSPQGAEIELNTGQKVLNFCANNYLGLSNNKGLIDAAKAALDDHGLWHVISKVYLWYKLICIKKLEKKIAEFFNTEDTISLCCVFRR